ncbi:unnamed protein product [Amoebophrya sp. A120]|nr:unnamed protein product [Amoebophrya sp. A120]|eukprot:GSA120T00025895001.1
MRGLSLHTTSCRATSSRAPSTSSCVQTSTSCSTTTMWQTRNRHVRGPPSTRSFATGKSIVNGTPARQGLLRGWNRLADAVTATLGPKGRNVVIEQMYGPPKITKDGVTVAKSIDLSGKMENLGAQLAKSVASKTNDIAGDGTTTATVLGRAMFREGCKAVAAGMNPMDLKRGIDHAVEVVSKDLSRLAKPVGGTEEIRQVATIAANSDTEIGNLLAEAFHRVGKEGNITVQDGNTLQHELEIVEGCRIDRGYLSPYFLDSPGSSGGSSSSSSKNQNSLELENPLILFYEKKLSHLEPLLPVLEQVVQAKRPLLIIAEDVEGEALSTLVVNKLRGGLRVCAIKAPGFGDNRKAMLHDMAVLTGGVVITEDVGLRLDQTRLEQLGNCKKCLIGKDSTTILEGRSSKPEIELRCAEIRVAMENTASEYEADKLKERLARLQGGVAVIKVGGSSEVEVGETRDRFADALCATRCALEEGVVPGGGTAFLYATESLKDVKLDNDDRNFGVQIVREVLKQPCLAIVRNAGKEGSIVVDKLLEGKDEKMGYDAQKDVFVNMLEAGILDPTKVVRTALEDASSVAGLLTTTEVVIHEADDDEKLSPMDRRAMTYD